MQGDIVFNLVTKLKWARTVEDIMGNTIRLEILAQKSGLLFTKYIYLDYYSSENYAIVHIISGHSRNS